MLRTYFCCSGVRSTARVAPNNPPTIHPPLQQLQQDATAGKSLRRIALHLPRCLPSLQPLTYHVAVVLTLGMQKGQIHTPTTLQVTPTGYRPRTRTAVVVAPCVAAAVKQKRRWVLMYKTHY